MIERAQATASSATPEWTAAGAIGDDPFANGPGQAWRGASGAGPWWWQLRFEQARRIGAILQVQGDDPTIFRNAPRAYAWQASDDGLSWRDLPETAVARERRLSRLHRLARPIEARFLRLRIEAAEGEAPAVRHIALFAESDAVVPFADWIVVVSTLEHGALPGAGGEFIPLARACPGWEGLQAQQVWLGDFDPAFVAVEPRPLCVFFSGNFRDWCQVPREPWRGTQAVLREGRLPMWAACGGAQGLAILSEAGVDREWDCPHCRDPRAPKLPIYTHIGHRAPVTGLACGEYDQCLDERGAFNVRQIGDDPAFAGLPEQFSVMESHCGQIEWPPEGWDLIVTAGAADGPLPGAHTRVQCLRVRDRPIYAAQFHVEMAGTPENSRRIMRNFLDLARAWGGYNATAPPLRLSSARSEP